MSGVLHPTGRGRVNARAPEALAICDRCGFTYNHSDLVWQYQFAGTTLRNTRLLVCKIRCLDVPQPQLRTIIIPPDPLPIFNPRPEQYFVSVNSFMRTLGGLNFATVSGDLLTQEIRVTPTPDPNQSFLVPD